MNAERALSDGPNFFVIGAQKAGTTRLCELLGRHRDVAIPTKEPAYFQSESQMRAKADWYQGLYRPVARVPARGDGSTYYSMAAIYPGTAARIHAHDPAARIIYLVRHPLRRIESAWAQLLSVGDANAFVGFERTLRDTDLLLEPTRYWKQLSEYRRYFPDEQITVHLFEEFIADEAATVASCLAFLGLDPTVPPLEGDQEGRNASEGKRQRLAVVDAVRLVPGYQRFKRLVPQALKTVLSENVTRPIPPVEWSDATRAWTIEQVADDAAAVLSYLERAEDYWPMR